MIAYLFVCNRLKLMSFVYPCLCIAYVFQWSYIWWLEILFSIRWMRGTILYSVNCLLSKCRALEGFQIVMDSIDSCWEDCCSRWNWWLRSKQKFWLDNPVCYETQLSMVIQGHLFLSCTWISLPVDNCQFFQLVHVLGDQFIIWKLSAGFPSRLALVDADCN
jgi:hypothetical protein